MRRELDHLARADEQQALRRDRREDALGELDRAAAIEIDALPMSVCVRTSLRHRERALEQAIEHEAERARRLPPSAPPASSGPGSAARPAPSSRARSRRGTRASPPSRAAACRRTAPASAAGKPWKSREPATPRARDRRLRSRPRCGCTSTGSPLPSRVAAPVRSRSASVSASGANTTLSRTSSGAVVWSSRGCRGTWRRSSASGRHRPRAAECH